jgi:hypothetical protein
MAEIKSTLDLVMERTKDLVQSEEEQTELQEKDRENKARGLLLKINDGRVKPENLPQALEDFGDDEGPFIRDKLLKIVIDNLTIGSENIKGMAVIENLAGDGGREELDRFKDLFLEYERSVKELSGVYEKKVSDVLKKSGISGSAIKPKVDHDPVWIDARTGMKNQFEARLSRIKNELAKRLGIL